MTRGCVLEFERTIPDLEKEQRDKAEAAAQVDAFARMTGGSSETAGIEVAQEVINAMQALYLAGCRCRSSSKSPKPVAVQPPAAIPESWQKKLNASRPDQGIVIPRAAAAEDGDLAFGRGTRSIAERIAAVTGASCA